MITSHKSVAELPQMPFEYRVVANLKRVKVGNDVRGYWNPDLALR